MDRLHQPLDGHIALLNEAGVQSNLRAVGVSAVVHAVVECAERVAVAAAVLIIALVGHNESKVGHIPALQIGKEAARPIEADDVSQAAVAIIAFLNAGEVGKRIVFHSVELHDTGRGERGQDREIRQVRGRPVAVIHAIDRTQWQALLIGFPSLPCGIQLVSNCFPRCLRSRNGLDSIDIGERDKGPPTSFQVSTAGVSASVPVPDDRTNVASIHGNGCIAAAVVGIHHSRGNIRRAR